MLKIKYSQVSAQLIFPNMNEMFLFYVQIDFIQLEWDHTFLILPEYHLHMVKEM